MNGEEIKKDKLFGIQKNVFALGLASLFNDFSNEMIQSVIPAFLAITLGVPAVGIGLIDGAADAISSFLKIFSGWFSDKIGRRKLPALAGYSLSVAVRSLYAVAGTFGEVFGIRVVDRIGKGFREGPRDALIGESVSKEEVGKSFGYNRAMDAMGGVLGPLGAFLILPLVGGSLNKLFVIAFLIGIVTLFTFLLVREVRPHRGSTLPKLDRKFFREHRRFSSYILSVFIFGMGTLPITLMLVRPLELGLKIADLPLLYFLYSIVFVLTAIPLGKLSDKFGKRKTIVAGFFMAIATDLLLAVSSSIYVAIVAFILFGLYSGATDGVERALTTRLVNPEYLATGEGLLNAAIGLSSLLAGFLGGLIWTIFNPQLAFLYAAVLSIVGTVIFLVFNFGDFTRDAAYRAGV